MNYRQARNSDITDIRQLLESYDLPASDIEAHLHNFIVVNDDAGLIAVGGYEDCEQYGLIRSFAVKPEYKGQGIAEAIYAQLTKVAIGSGKQGFYLLTTTASDYFSRLDFSVCDRSEVPECIRATKQFSDLCPGSATVMMRDL